jgi:hypothetical protein
MQSNVDKGYKGIGMEGRIAAWYARNTARDMPDFVALAERVTTALPGDVSLPATAARLLEAEVRGHGFELGFRRSTDRCLWDRLRSHSPEDCNS